MSNLRISVITVCYNTVTTIEKCIASVVSQNFKDIEYIIVDGGSTDGTLEIINRYRAHVSILISEPDNGIYDAMNKGLKLATGQVAGTLNADDYFADNDILCILAKTFTEQKADIVYGDLDYVDGAGDIIRKWRSGIYKRGMLEFGWMPPHPTFYCKKDLLLRIGLYSLDYGTAADYALMLQIIKLPNLQISYINRVLVIMKIGGASNKSISNRVEALKNDLKAMRNNEISLPLITLVLKPLLKVLQFLT
jgi:glycosyltransferase involved in cell wall biosynthesis